MMGRRAGARNGAEQDAITSWRFVTSWRHVPRAYWKRTLRRRERRVARGELRAIKKAPGG